MVRALVVATVVAGNVVAAVPVSAATEPFGQETVETRPPRHPRAKSSLPHLDRGDAHRDRHHHGLPQERGHLHDTDAHGIETENLFGFTLGSDTEPAGASGAAIETVARFDKRDGSYTAIGKKLEFTHGVTDDLSIALGIFANYHRIRAVTDFEDVRTLAFNGIGGEVRWRLLRRGPHPVGVTVHIEPNWQTHDELTGIRARKFGAENKLIVDAELIPETLYAALNLLYELERVREHGAGAWEKASKLGVAVALAGKVTEQAVAGIELRYLRAYEGLTLGSFTGDAVFLGPTLFARIGRNGWIALAWNAQVHGREIGSDRKLNLADFERHQIRLKLGIEF